MYCLTVLEAGNLRSRCQQGWFLLRAVTERDPSMFLLQHLVVSVKPWHSVACGSTPGLCSILIGHLPVHISQSKFVLLLRAPVISDYTHPKALILTSYICNDPIAKESYILRYWGLGLQYMNGGVGHNSAHNG